MLRRAVAMFSASALAVIGLTAGHAATSAASTADAQASTVTLPVDEFTLPDATIGSLRNKWVDQLEATYGDGHWAPMKMDLDDADLAEMGLPPKSVLTAHRYAEPTWFDSAGTARPVRGGSGGGGATSGGSGGTSTAMPVVSYAGIGSFGIRPGAWLLLITNDSVGWCSMAHVYGSPGAYQISTAGHCGKVGDTATAIGLLGDKSVSGVPVPVLMDFGTFSKSTGDAGIGKDWALIGVKTAYQPLVSPTMAFWGGPIGQYKDVGNLATVSWLSGKGINPQVTTDPDPFLVQGIVHYGHGAGIGTGGTPRAGTAFTWQPTYYAFEGAITPGDSGSGANTLTGDTVGADRQAAGINTHIYVDASLKTGIGYLAGTRVTSVGATLANGQLVPYPVPAPGLP